MVQHDPRTSAGDGEGRQVTLGINPGRAVLILSTFVPVLAAMSLFPPFMAIVMGHGRVLGLVPLVRELFSMQVEANIPTWFSSLLHAACAAVAWVVARGDSGPIRRSWYVVAAVFAWLSVDEAAAIHEKFNQPFRSRGIDSGFLYNPWVIAGGILALVVVTVLLPWFVRLPARTRWLFLASGILFVGGSLGMEMVVARHFDARGSDNFTYFALTNTEEVLELLGILTAFYALLDYSRRRSIGLSVRLVPGPHSSSSAGSTEPSRVSDGAVPS